MSDRYISEEVICRLIKCSDHCTSCHEDYDEGYSISLLFLCRDRYAEVCCAVSIAFDNWIRASNRKSPVPSPYPATSHEARRVLQDRVSST